MRHSEGGTTEESRQVTILRVDRLWLDPSPSSGWWMDNKILLPNIMIMKKFVLWLSALLLWSSMVYADYTPTAQDTALMDMISPMIDDLTERNALNISMKLHKIKSDLDPDSRKYRFAAQIIWYIADMSPKRNSYIETETISDDYGIQQINLPTVKRGDIIRVDYIWSLEDGSVFDTSILDVAKKSGIYQLSRWYVPLEFEVWAGQMILWFDTGVVGMQQWETKTLVIPPDQAYGRTGSHFLAGETLVFEVTVIGVE